jgi:hypothetical protein
LIPLLLVSALTSAARDEARTNAASEAQRPFQQRSGDGIGPREHGYRGWPGPSSNAEARYVEMWLEQLKQKSPQEFEKARKLREENPEEFRRHLREKVASMKMRGGLEERPEIARAIKALPETDREWLLQRLQAGDRFGMRGGMPDMRGGGTPEMERGELATRELVQKARAATGEERARLRAELKTELGRLFDLREKYRAEQLRMVEQQVTSIREQLQERSAKRDEIIEHRLKEAMPDEPPPK